MSPTRPTKAAAKGLSRFQPNRLPSHRPARWLTVAYPTRPITNRAGTPMKMNPSNRMTKIGMPMIEITSRAETTMNTGIQSTATSKPTSPALIGSRPIR